MKIEGHGGATNRFEEIEQAANRLKGIKQASNILEENKILKRDWRISKMLLTY